MHHKLSYMPLFENAGKPPPQAKTTFQIAELFLQNALDMDRSMYVYLQKWTGPCSDRFLKCAPSPPGASDAAVLARGASTNPPFGEEKYDGNNL